LNTWCRSLLFAFLLSTTSAARADTLDDIRQRGTIRWGGDKEGGGPYVYEDPNNPQKLIGFEVELMDRLAERLGVKAEFRQAQWDTLPELLKRRPDQIDIIVNGYELTSQHLQHGMIATLPYYVYELQLIARKDDTALRAWEDLGKRRPDGSKPRVGVLAGTAAEKYISERFGNAVELRAYNGTTDSLLEVATKKIEATVTDTPPAAFYKDRHRELSVVGAPVGRGYYVIYARAGDERLRDELDRAILQITRSGELRQIDERYGIWNDGQAFFRAQESPREQTAEADEGSAAAPTGWAATWKNMPLLVKGALVTVELTLLSMPMAMLIGLFVALGRLYGPAPLRLLLTAYVEVLRGTPLLLQLYVIFFLLPLLGVNLPPVAAGVMGLAINYSAYEAEIYRAGVLAIPVGQMEAALSLGFTRRQALRHIIVPQAFRLVLPPVTNDFIALFKDTAVCSVITIVELTKQYSITANTTGAYLQVAAIAALLYLAMSYPLALMTRRLEKRTPPINA